MAQSSNPCTANPDRKPVLLEAARKIFAEASGQDLPETASATSFLDLGFDSLFLTQFSQSIQKKFGLKISFRQLLDDVSSLDLLVSWLDGKLAPGAFQTEAVQIPATSQAASPAISDTEKQSDVKEPLVPAQAANGRPGSRAASFVEASTIERLVQEQLQVMADQLALLRGAITTPDLAPAQPVVPSQESPKPSRAAAPAPPEVARFGPFKPIQRGASGGLTEGQQQHLDALIARYNKRTAGSKQMAQEHRAHFCDPRAAGGFRQLWKEMVYPIVAQKSLGSRVWDIDGNEYIDVTLGFGADFLGHSPPYVVKAVEEQLKLGFEIGPQSPLAGEIAQTLCKMTGMERATFTNTGSEAVMAAMRVARTVTGKDKVVYFLGDYHGIFDEVLARPATVDGKAGAAPIAPGIPQENLRNMIVLEYGSPASLEIIRANISEIAAVIVEPVQSRHPDLQPREFLHELRRITEEGQTALVFDEIVTGFRCHIGGAQAYFGIRADMATYGKIIGGGLPVGVLAGSAKYMDALDGGQWKFGDGSFPEVGVTFFAGTFVRHPLAMAAAHAVMKHLQEAGPSLQEQANERTARFVRTLNDYFKERQVPMRLQTFSSVFYYDFHPDLKYAGLLFYYLRDRGVHIWEGRFGLLSVAHSDADVDALVVAFKESVDEMQAAGFLPAGDPSGEPETVKPAVPAPSATAAVSVPAATGAPLTEAQLEVWLAAQLAPEANCAYNESFTVRFRGPLNLPALREALQETINRHEALRAVIAPDGTQQRFAAPGTLDLRMVDLSSLPAQACSCGADAVVSQAGQVDPIARKVTACKCKLERIIDEDARLPFNLNEGPLLRVALIKLEADVHWLIFTSHHIVCDGWSTNVILDELSRLYSAKCQGQSCDLPAPMAFSAYSRSQSDFVKSAEGAAMAKYWVEQFSKPVPLLDLPTDRPRPAVKGYSGATCRRTIGAGAYRDIKRAGAQQKCTLFATLLAGFQALLSRLARQDDIVVGIPAAGQSLLEDQILVGHCVNFLPVRAQVVGDRPMSELLAQVKRSLLNAYEHQNYTYGRLVKDLALPKDPGRLPLMEVQFNVERVGTGVAFRGLEVEVDPNPKSAVIFDLFLNVIESNDGLVLDCDYNTELFDIETIDRWLGHYETLLLGMAADASQPIARLPLLHEDERRLMLVDWNQTEAEYPHAKCLHQLIEEQAARTPDSVAAVFESEELTYSQMDAKANQLAGYLRQLGVGPEVLVGICIDRSLEMLTGILGVLKAGGAYVPLDPMHPKDRLALILGDSNPSVILTQRRLLDGLPGGDATKVCLDSTWETPSGNPGAATPSPVTSDNLAYVIYTSGSTGKPKGVGVTHRSVVNFLQSMRREPGLESSDTLLAVTTLSFDIAGLELFLPLTVGAKLVIASREATFGGTRLMETISKCGATAMQATPITWRLLLESGWKGDPQFKMLCGGEAWSRDLANQLLQRGSSLWNMYGPTETTIWSSTVKVTRSNGPVPLGPPIANTRFYILDELGQPAPIGVPGELHIAGDGVARGYVNRPDLTAEKFIPDPFWTKSEGNRMYKTGDLARYLPDRQVEFLGRIDHQVKLRGFRIELGEIESLLAQHPTVAENVVVLREDSPGDKRLVAYVVAAPGQTLVVEQLRDLLAGKLPEYMVPAFLVVLKALPRTPNGKTDRKGLPPPNLAEVSCSREFVAPRTPEEAQLAQIWAQVLRLDRVGATDSLFELGADSLHVFQITARANQAGLKVTPKLVLQHRTISAIIAAMADDGKRVEKPAGPALIAVPRDKFRVRRPADVNQRV